MRLVAIYIDDHEYLFDKPQTINLGGKYLYNFTKSGKRIIVKRELNEKFIEGFFNLTNLKTRVTNVNAIVGQNGAGKSSLLDLIRSCFIEKHFALPRSHALFLVETNEDDLPRIVRSDFDKVYIQRQENIKRQSELLPLKDVKIQTLYYSPHFDYKYNPNFGEVDDHDISFDKILQEDLEDIREKDDQENGFPYPPIQELIFKNSLRQIEFLGSDIVSKQQIFKDLFNLQDHYEPLLVFRGYREREREWNTPYNFRDFLKKIVDTAEKELNDWHKIRKFKGQVVINQAEINKYILKRNVIVIFTSLFYRQMEKGNTYLQEGFLRKKEVENDVNTLDAYQLLLLFIDQASVYNNKKEVTALFKESTLKILIEKIYHTIDSASSEEDVTVSKLRASKEQAIELLQLQRTFLSELNRYYHIFRPKDDIIPDEGRIEEFINYMPFSRRMSSGESALLNLFSRIYHFLNFNLKVNKYRELNDYYILLLDEADLSFHPSWKKRYVKALLKTIPYFFSELNNHPSVQIIFTTHDPLTLSDIPNPNVVYIERRDYNSVANILNYEDERRPTKTFGANISDLLADSFFIEESLIGDFALDTIHSIIEWLNNKENYQNSDYFEKLISTIDEPIVKRKLAEMFDEKMQTQLQLKLINKQIKELEAARKKLKK